MGKKKKKKKKKKRKRKKVPRLRGVRCLTQV
jgi:hypothetical protein